MTAILLYGLLLGLSAGVSPGPLLTLVIDQSLRHGRKEGMKVALAPMITDLPILALALGLYSTLPALDTVLGAVSLIGAGFVAFLGYQSLKPLKAETAEVEAPAPRSILKGSLVNLLSPHPYIFWFGLGAPTMMKASRENVLAAAGFALCFLSVISGSKMVIAELVGRSRTFLTGPSYRALTRGLGLALFVFALILVRDGLRLLGWLGLQA